MMQLLSKNDDSSLCYDVIITHQKFKIDKFGDFSSDIDYNSRTDIFRDVISLLMNQCDPRRPKGASGGHKLSASRAAQASLYIYIYIYIYSRLRLIGPHRSEDILPRFSGGPY